MPQLTTDEVHSVAIDALNEWWFPIYGEESVSLNLDGTAAADYSIDVGVEPDTPSTDNWFNDKDTAAATSTIRRTYTIPERWIRLRVTTAATSGATADISVTAD